MQKEEPRLTVMQPSQQMGELGPKSLVVREPTLLLALPTLGTKIGLEEVERRLEASQLGFQKVVMKHIQSLTDQMTLMVRSQ